MFDDFLNGIDPGDDSARVILSPETRHDVFPNYAIRDSIGQDAFQAVTDFEPELAVFNSDQKDDAIVETFLADFPILRDADAETFDVLAIERGDRQNCDLMARFLFELRELRFQRAHLILAHDAGVVVYPAAQRRHFNGQRQE